MNKNTNIIKHTQSFVDPRDGIWRKIRTQYNVYKPQNSDPITIAMKQHQEEPVTINRTTTTIKESNDQLAVQ